MCGQFACNSCRQKLHHVNRPLHYLYKTNYLVLRIKELIMYSNISEIKSKNSHCVYKEVMITRI